MPKFTPGLDLHDYRHFDRGKPVIRALLHPEEQIRHAADRQQSIAAHASAEGHEGEVRLQHDAGPEANPPQSFDPESHIGLVFERNGPKENIVVDDKFERALREVEPGDHDAGT